MTSSGLSGSVLNGFLFVVAPPFVNKTFTINCLIVLAPIKLVQSILCLRKPNLMFLYLFTPMQNMDVESQVKY